MVCSGGGRRWRQLGAACSLLLSSRRSLPLPPSAAVLHCSSGSSAVEPCSSFLFSEQPAPFLGSPQELTRGNLLVLAVGAACTVWLYDLLYEEREAAQVGGNSRCCKALHVVVRHAAVRGLVTFQCKIKLQQLAATVQRMPRRPSAPQAAEQLKRRRQAEGEPRRIPDV